MTMVERVHPIAGRLENLYPSIPMRQPKDLNERVRQAAERVLEAKRYVSPIDLLIEMRLLAPPTVLLWEKGGHDCLEPHIQGSATKLAQTFEIFTGWAQEKHLHPIKAALRGLSRDSSHELRVTIDANPQKEEFFRTCYGAAVTPRQLDTLVKKVNKPPELAVFMTVSESVHCAECGAGIEKGGFLFREKDDSLCLQCADLDHLEFLPSGDAALSRRTRKHSALAAVVLQFNRRAKRYERRGILAPSSAIAQAEQECLLDAGQRAVQRERGAVRRTQEDALLIRDMAAAIVQRYPGCPPSEAASIAAHTACRGSGRVGRSAAGRQFDDDALRLAVVAHVRHVHTRYDEMLMNGTPRQEARTAIAARIDEVLRRWQGQGVRAETGEPEQCGTHPAARLSREQTLG